MQQCPGKDFAHAIQGYAMRFLQHNNSSHVQHCAPEAPVTPDKIYDFGVLDMSWEDHLTEVWTIIDDILLFILLVSFLIIALL